MSKKIVWFLVIIEFATGIVISAKATADLFYIKRERSQLIKISLSDLEMSEDSDFYKITLEENDAEEVSEEADFDYEELYNLDLGDSIIDDSVIDKDSVNEIEDSEVKEESENIE